jgi:UDP-N-acetylglucosamine diphosphorylase / glucose-1-phosphate thymidylyltransferase / UDP-N-acetylgalactosamine diphosphorylase / glucosamine-1-phosphate N-acetyltransferase / galactosamine-1-phosphate N-acetyltransferase
MKGVILAAGKGTRLRPLTETTPKPLLLLNGKPMLDYVLEGYRAAGVTEVILITGYLAEQIENHYKDGAALGMNIAYKRQDKQLGTGHAVRLARDFTADAPFLLCWSDIMCDLENYAALIDFHRRGGFEASITLDEVDDPWEGAAVYMDGDLVRDIIEKPPKGESTTNLNNRGIFVLEPGFYYELETLEPDHRGEYNVPDAIRNLIRRGGRVGGMRMLGPSSDVGTIQALEEWEAYLKR